MRIKITKKGVRNEQKQSEEKQDPNTLLEAAIMNQDIKKVESLLQRGANPNLKIYDDKTSSTQSSVLTKTCLHTHNVEIAKLLIKYGANKADLNPLVSDAIEKNDLKQVDYLLKIGFDVNVLFNEGFLPSRRNRDTPEMTKLLIKHADKHKLSHFLAYAIIKLNVDLLRIILDSGIDLNQNLFDGITPLKLASMVYTQDPALNIRLIELLIFSKRGDELTSREAEQMLRNVSMDHHRRHGADDVLCELIRAGANPFQVTRDKGFYCWSYFDWTHQKDNPIHIDPRLISYCQEAEEFGIRRFYGFDKVLSAFENYLKENPGNLTREYGNGSFYMPGEASFYLKQISSILELRGYQEDQQSEHLLKWINSMLGKIECQNNTLRDILLAIRGDFYYKCGKRDLARKDWLSIHMIFNIPKKYYAQIGEGLCIGSESYTEGSNNHTLLMHRGLQFLMYADSDIDARTLNIRYLTEDESELSKEIGLDSLNQTVQAPKKEQKEASISLDENYQKSEAEELKDCHQKIEEKLEALESVAQLRLHEAMTQLADYIKNAHNADKMVTFPMEDKDCKEMKIFFGILCRMYNKNKRIETALDFVEKMSDMLEYIYKYKPQIPLNPQGFDSLKSTAFLLHCDRRISDIKKAIEVLIKLYGSDLKKTNIH